MAWCWGRDRDEGEKSVGWMKKMWATPNLVVQKNLKKIKAATTPSITSPTSFTAIPQTARYITNLNHIPDLTSLFCTINTHIAKPLTQQGLNHFLTITHFPSPTRLTFSIQQSTHIHWNTHPTTRPKSDISPRLAIPNNYYYPIITPILRKNVRR